MGHPDKLRGGSGGARGVIDNFESWSTLNWRTFRDAWSSISHSPTSEAASGDALQATYRVGTGG